MNSKKQSEASETTMTYRDSILTPPQKAPWTERYIVLIRTMKVLFFPIWCILYVTFIIGMMRFLYGYLWFGDKLYVYHMDVYGLFWQYNVKNAFKYWNLFEKSS